MFKHIGEKIKDIAASVCWLGIIICIFWGIFTISAGDGEDEAVLIGFVIIIVGIIVSWLSSCVLYGFGQLVDNSDKLVELQQQKNSENEAGISDLQQEPEN